MNFLDIEKSKIYISCFSIFHVFFAFDAISNIKKKICVKKNSGGGGGGVLTILSHFISRFMLFSTLQKYI